MITAEELTEIGRYNKTHGVNGEISATFDCDTLLVGELSTLISPMDGIFVPFFVENVRTKSGDTLLLTIDGIASEEQAKKLVNAKIYALTEEMPEQDEVYCDYFVGFSIIAADGNEVGRITAVDDSTENALFVVENQGKTLYVPISEDFILEIDEEKKSITMELPDGLLDL